VGDPIGVLIADDDQNVLDVLTALITSEPAFRVVGAVRDAESAIDVAGKITPDVALLDARMPGGGGIRAAREIRRRSPSTSVIAVSAHEDAHTVVSMLEAGAVAYVAKGDSTDEIIRAIHRSRAGETTLSSGVVHVAAEALARHHAYHDRVAAARRRATERIRRAMTEDHGLSMVFQPITDLRFGFVAGVEALSRFGVRPRRTPDRWFAEAASVGLGTDLEVAAARKALEHLPELLDGMYLSINVSPDTLCSPKLKAALSGHRRDRVVLEITEHAPVHDYDELKRHMAILRDQGVRFAIDDVGAGFSSLRHVVALRPDFIKLDIALTRDIDTDRARRALASGLIAFASEMGASIVAEGIETRAELATLRELGVVFGQGYFLAPPGPPDPRRTALTGGA
jgi:EAL domain-containing protein (putative c-di-GMP-specific phosphodiesterase class I)/CheY-like chemotaxis protein